MKKLKIELELTEDVVKQTYKLGDSNLKSSLEKQLGKKFFGIDLKQRVENIDDVYKELGRTKPTLKNYLHIPTEKNQRALNTQYIDDISELFNEGWKPDFDNATQWKYYPWFRKVSSGWVVSSYSNASGDSRCGSGLYFKDRETALWCGNKFLDIYTKILD